MPCEFCPHCREQAQVDAALAAQVPQNDDLPVVAAPPAPNHIVPTLNGSQQPIAFDICNNWRTDKLHFIEGNSNSGKTYLLHAIWCLFKNMPINVEVISQSSFPVPAKNMLKFLALTDNLIEEIDVILIDSGNQIMEQHMKSLCEKLKRVMGNDTPFGGKTIIVVADFGQLLPFSPGNRNPRVGESLRHLTRNMVAPFKHHVLPVGTDDWALLLDTVRKSPRVTFPAGVMVAHLDELISFCFGPLQGEPPIQTSIILTPKKEGTEVINRRVLEKMRGRIQILEAQFNDRVIRSDLELHQLRLKKNCILVLEEPCEGLPKGTRLTFHEATRSHLCCTDIATNLSVDLPRVNRYLGPQRTEQQLVKQFPVSVNFGATIHASEGRKFEKVGIYKAGQVFEHGMLYTAVSRAESLEGLRVHSDEQVIVNKLEMSLI
uniref:ATP-dependent DNA helicase n=1 Tax=Caenorhabditis tropicalis TaxID=1561998 RepID=A0A1I7USS3_9PELO